MKRSILILVFIATLISAQINQYSIAEVSNVNVRFSIAYVPNSGVEEVLTAGDMLAFAPNQLSQAEMIKGKYHNISISVAYLTITDLEEGVGSLPEFVEWVAYDYEPGPGQAPEFSRVEDETITLIKRAKAAAESANKKLLVSFTFASIRNLDWDFGEIAKYMDMMHVQMQGIQSQPDIVIKNAKELASEVKLKSPDTLFQIQLSYRRDGSDNIPDIITKLVNDSNIDGFALLLGKPENHDIAKNMIKSFKGIPSHEPKLAKADSISARSLLIVDQSGNMLNKISAGEEVNIQSELINNLKESINLTYIVLITDSKGITVSLSWVEKSIAPAASIKVAQSWLPDTKEVYTVQVFVWDDMNTPEPLLLKPLVSSISVS